jgi:hypothetical protein
MAFADVHDAAHGGKQVAALVGAKPVGDLPKDGAHADRLFASVIGQGSGGIFQKKEQVILNLLDPLRTHRCRLRPRATGDRAG